jgi:hypothetical protein
MATDGPDPYAKEQPQGVATWIRRALGVSPEPTAARPGGSPDRRRIVVLGEAGVTADATELFHLVGHPDPFVRCRAADLLGRLPQAAGRSKAVLTALLADDGFADVGVMGPHVCDGRLYHWHRARRSPRAAAIRALFALGHVPPGDRMLTAMLAESVRAATVCGERGTAGRFTAAQWDAAVGAAGGFAAAEQQVRTARRVARNTGWSGEEEDKVAFSATSELDEVTRRLSGQLV